MLFYEMEFTSTESIEKSSKDEQYSENSRICQAVAYHNKEGKKETCCYVAQISNNHLILALCVQNDIEEDFSLYASEFVKNLKIDASLTNIKEITIESFIQLIRMADNNNLVKNDRMVFNELGIQIMFNYEGSPKLKEEVIKELKDKESAISRAKGVMYVPELLSEVDRIFTPSAQKTFLAHPVQYVLMSDDDEIRATVRETLVASLYKVKRLKSRRICFVGTNTSESYQNTVDAEVAEDLYKAQCGSTLIFQPEQCSIIGGSVSNQFETLQRVCKQIQKYHADTLTIIELSRNDEITLEQIQRELPDIRFIVFKENTIFTEEAKEYLLAKAKADKITNTEGLVGRLAEEQKGYYPSDLKTLYSKWFDDRLCTEVYPQYKKIEVAASKIKNLPKGDAFKQLEKLIGLSDAKKTIKSAVDFHNAQKMFEQNGFAVSNIARHMVFTGNPGSAKTTVARLFAQIMKDNKLLSEGNLIECGRADIVDMYVGGTAPRVQRLFKRARGNVLFIDEAYSLCDGRRGLYGDEAINTIVQEMENHRDETIVIFAGYPGKMEEFLNTNPGLRSRIAFHVPFDDYNPDELMQILRLFVKENGLSISSDVEAKVLPIFMEAVKHPDFGNGRFVRNLFDKARMNQAGRLMKMDATQIDKDILSTLTVDDFEMPVKYAAKQHNRTIGFAV